MKLTYPGDVSATAPGQIVGPAIGGRQYAALSADHNPDTNHTRVALVEVLPGPPARPSLVLDIDARKLTLDDYAGDYRSSIARLISKGRRG